MSDGQEFSEFAKKQYQEAKKIKRTKVALDQAQVIIFAQLLSRNSPLINYEDKLGLGCGDVETQKEILGLYDPGAATAFLKAIDGAAIEAKKSSSLTPSKDFTTVFVSEPS